jgi:hypothetical protein
MRNFLVLTGLISILGAICVLRIEYDQGCDRREAAMVAAVAMELKRLDDAGWARIREEEAAEREQAMLAARAMSRCREAIEAQDEASRSVRYRYDDPRWTPPVVSVQHTTWSAPIRPLGQGYDVDPRVPQGGWYQIGTAIPGVR